MRVSLVVAMAAFGGLSACALTQTHEVSVSHVQSAPRSRDVAEIPLVLTGGNADQDHGGVAIAPGTAPDPSASDGFAMIMQTGGHRPVESVNSLPSAP